MKERRKRTGNDEQRQQTDLCPIPVCSPPSCLVSSIFRRKRQATQREFACVVFRLQAQFCGLLARINLAKKLGSGFLYSRCCQKLPANTPLKLVRERTVFSCGTLLFDLPRSFEPHTVAGEVGQGAG